MEKAQQYLDLLKDKMVGSSFEKLTALENEKLTCFIGQFATIAQPESIYMCDDSDEDADYIRKTGLNKGEETPLARADQTIHYDGYGDQGRDKNNTRFMVAKENLAKMGNLNCIEAEQGLAEIKELAQGIMKGKQMIVKLFCECPPMGPFTIGCAQITDSYYVTHSEDILYRRGYQHFKRMTNKDEFFRFFHSAGELDERGCTVNTQNRRIYQDLENMRVFTINNQYAGNSVGLKKLAMRLAIKKSSTEGWLCEHMFIMGCKNEEKNRTTYFCGAYPSACGKTATAMLPGETIIGDDIAYFKNINGEFRAANVERGIFGIIKDVNEKDDPVIYKVLTNPQEVIFSNILTGPDNNPYWPGMGMDTPKEGANHSGPGWFEGKKDANDKVIPLAHGNARYTIRLNYLDNLDPNWDNKNGVSVGGVIYGGRDSDTCVPVEESLNWEDGIIMKACTLESETTSATLGQEGVRVPQPMANLDFISYPIGQYIMNNLNFTKDMKYVPNIFATNYFLKDTQGEFCNHKLAKKVWLHWAELRVNKEVDVLPTPTGMIPKYDDLAKLFQDIFNEDYTQEEYDYQFSFRCDKWLAKLERSIAYFQDKVPDCPQLVYERFNQAIDKIKAIKDKQGAVIKPGCYTID
jgi:phosphoenolpyruvate carboxykinase (GTP)